MPGSYKFIDHTADIACEISGDTIDELFTAASEAWRSSVVEETNYCEIETKTIELESFSKEQLLVDFLNELNFLLFTRKWLFNLIVDISITKKNGEWEIKAEIEGMPLSSEIKLKQEIKAITFHQMEIEKKGNKYSTLLVFDI